MVSNIITLTRIFLSFRIITLFRQYIDLDVTLIFTIFLIFMLDAVDDSVVQKRNETAETGVLLDTIVDKTVENVFWIYLTATRDPHCRFLSDSPDPRRRYSQ